MSIMNSEQLYNNIYKKRSYLCVGLDSDLAKFPDMFKEKRNALFEFNKAIIDETVQYAVAYKLNTAFYEACGAKGWDEFEMSVRYIKEQYPDILVIADAKRGDIGNTAQMYAKAFFDNLPCDVVTLAPYMGSDSIKPFLQYPDKWAAILAITSNLSASDFETLWVERSESEIAQATMRELGMQADMPLYEKVIRETMRLGTIDNIMFVVGATRPEKLKEIRKYCPNNFFLVPGVGAQGGTIEEVAANGMNDKCGILVNSSRGIIYADNTDKFAKVAGLKAKEMVEKMSQTLEK
jgi:orotidine 5''-phosphate decarboxylase, subfamily 2